MRPELLLAGDLAGDLAGGNLVEQADRTVGLLRQGVREGLHLHVQGCGVVYQEAGEALALLGRECVGSGDQLRDLVAHKGGVVDVGGLDPRLEVFVHYDRLVGRGDREPGFADPVAGQAGPAGGNVFALGQLDDQVAGQSRSDILGLADDPQSVVGEQVELGDLVARVGDAEAEVAGRGFLGRDGAGIRAAVNRDRRPVGTGRGVGDAAGESEQADRGDDGEVRERGAHESPWQ